MSGQKIIDGLKEAVAMAKTPAAVKEAMKRLRADSHDPYTADPFWSDINAVLDELERLRNGTAARVLGQVGLAFRLRAEAAEARLEKARAVVNEQAEDEGLWFVPVYITEDGLQRALRRLHEAVEGVSQEEAALAALTDAPPPSPGTEE